jgi:hypothetical protein
MPTFTYTNGYTYTAKSQMDGVLIDPKLPRNFDISPNENRPASHAKWWGFPFIVTTTVARLDAFYAQRTDEYAEAQRKHWEENRPKWLEAWPTGTSYEVCCLDGDAWDRATSWGEFATVEEAVLCAKTGANQRGFTEVSGGLA